MSSPADEKRERDIRLLWERAPNAPILQRDRAPPGLRTPSGFVWGHQLGHLFWIARIPGANALTIWSRSMIKEGDEGHDEHVWDEPLTAPRVRRPWPVLKAFVKDPDRDGTKTELVNEPDRGCPEEHWQGIDPPKGWTRDPRAVLSPEMLGLLGECEFDPEEKCTGPMLANAGPERVVNRRGEAYDYVWCEHFKALLNEVCDPLPVMKHAVAVTGHVHIVPDAIGMIFYAPPGDVRDAAGAADIDKDGEPGAASGEASAVDTPEDTASVSTKNDVMEDDASASASGGSEEEAATSSEASAASDDSVEAAAARVISSLPPSRNPYLVDDLPKLEEFIPQEHLPDILMVHDLHNVTTPRKPRRSESESDGDIVPIKYKRVYPVSPEENNEHQNNEEEEEESEGENSPQKGKGKEKKKEEKEENVAHLHLSKDNRFGAGNHSFVYRAPLTLPAPLLARSPSGQTTVAAKLAYSRCTAHGLLHNEARVYDSLPKHTQEDWCGFHVVPQCRFPVPASAVAPKFYGYYLPVDASGGVRMLEHKTCDEDAPCSVEWPSPILLMEECGRPVEPSKFTADQRTECFSLILRLHHMDIIQGSFYVRNIMCQPGPLAAPPGERSYATPSFRIIDFGRGRCWEWDLKEARGDVGKRRFEFARKIGDEVARARSELLIEDFGF